MTLENGLKIIKTLRNYQIIYDKCPNVVRKQPTKVCQPSDFSKCTMSDSFSGNGGVKWFFLMVFTIELIIAALSIHIIAGIIAAIIHLLIFGIWMKKILKKTKEIKIAKQKVAAYNKEVRENEVLYTKQIAAERERIQNEYLAFIAKYTVPKWMLQIEKGCATSYTTSYYKHTTHIPADKIKRIYHSKTKNIECLSDLDPIWICKKKCVTEELIYIAEKNPSLSTYEELRDVYRKFSEIKKEFYSLVSVEYRRIKKRSDDWETQQIREDVAMQRQQEMHEETMTQLKRMNELHEKTTKMAADALAIAEKERYTRYIQGRDIHL